MTDVTVKLSKPITAHGREYSELRLRKPNGKDIRECGLPLYSGVDENDNKIQKIDTASVARYVRNLAGIPLSATDQLGLEDYASVVAVVVGFFTGKTTETPQTETVKADQV